MEREGMAALVRGLREAGLAVSVLDSSQILNQNKGRDPAHYRGRQVKDFSTQSCEVKDFATPPCQSQMVADRGAQAVDGRYASTYQLMHCNLRPTSPPVQLSEFPRQRHNVLPGQPNFEIGGTDGAFRTNNYTSNRETVSLAGARTREADPFVSSLRKYPAAHTDKAQDLIHRHNLVTQSKVGQSPRYHSPSNTIVSVDVRPASWHHSGDDEVLARNCPARERREPATRGPSPLPQHCGKTARTLLSECVRTNYPYGWPVYPNRRHECAPLLYNPELFQTSAGYKMVNVSSQAGVKMISKEVSTPRRPARSVAVSPSMMSFSVYTEGECRVPSSDRLVQVNSSSALARYNSLNNVHTMRSVEDLGRKLCNNTSLRKSKSEQQIKINVNNDVVGVGDSCVDDETVRYEVFKQIIDCHKQPVKDITSPINTESQYIDKAPYIASECKFAGFTTECIKTVTMKSNNSLDKRAGSYLITKSDHKRLELFETNRTTSDSNTNLRNELQHLHHIANCSSSKCCMCTLLGNDLQCCDITGQSVDYNKKIILLNKTKSMIILENRLKSLVKNIFKEYFEKYSIEVNVHLLQVLENDVFSILVTSVQLIKFNNDSYVKIKLEDILKDHLGQITNKQAANITHFLLQSARNILNEKYLQNRSYTVCYLYTEEDVKLLNASDKLSRQKLIPLVIKDIHDWLKDLKISPNVEKEAKRKMIKDLADDIVDRYLYLKLNPPCRPTNDEEIEYLKFQIYKWIRRLLGDDTKKILLRAQELMDRIRNTSDPVIKIVPSTSQNSTNKIDLAGQGGTLKPYFINNAIPSESRRKWQIPSCSKQLCRRNSVWNLPQFVNETQILTSSYDGNFIAAHTDCCKNNTIPLQFSTGTPDYSSNQSNFNPTVQKLNEDYDYYLKQWVQEIPIIVYTPEEQKLADIARLGIYNGIWKAITKLSLDPKVFNNYFYYQDLLEIEIDDLLSNLPETEQLQNNKDRLKSQLLEKTVIMIDRIKNAVAPSSFKQLLLENLGHNLPRASRFEPHLAEKEELLKVALVEDYILFIYFEDDDAKSYVYKKKYLRKINELADYLKKNHKNQFKHIDTKGHENELIFTMSKVPIPEDNIIQKETFEILLGQEIDHWISDLPMKTNIRPLQKLQFRDITAKKINEIFQRTGWVDDATRVELHKFLPKDMQKLPLEEGANVSFLIEELANRLKAFPKTASRRKAVSFEMSTPYTEFNRDVPACSSYTDQYKTLNGDISNITVKGKIERDANPKVSCGPKRGSINGSEWISMDETKTPAGLMHWPSESVQTSGSHKVQGTTIECRDTSCSSKKLLQQTPIHTDHAKTSHASITQFKPSIPDYVNQSTAMPGRSFSLGDLNKPKINSKDQISGQQDTNKSPSMCYTNGRKRNDGPCQCMKRFICPGPMIWFYDISCSSMCPMGIFPCFH